MAVIAIGDFEKENIVSLIKEHFSSLTNPTQARPREVYSVPLTTKDSVHFVTDTEETTTIMLFKNILGKVTFNLCSA